MSMTASARATANRAANNSLLERVVRAGFLGYGVVHLLFAWLALQIAFGRPAGTGDQSGALQTLAAQPLGRTLVIIVAIGLVAMALWQLLEATVGHREDRGKTRIFERIGSAARTLVYAYLAYTAYRVFNAAGASNADSQQTTSTHLMSSSGGRWLVALAGLVLAGIGIGLVWYGVTKRFRKHLMMGQMSPRTRRVSERLGMAGYAAKGVAYGIAGVLLFLAAVNYDPQKARGLDAALRTLAEQRYGTVLLTAVAVGIAAAGVFCFVQARYRKV